jgi:hypothetical protein
LRQDIPWRRAILVGAVAFLVGMGATFGLLMVDASLSDSGDASGVDDSESGSEDSNEPGFLDVMGWLYFNTHFVDIEGEDATTSESIDLLDLVLEDADNTLPTFLYRLIPPGVLLASGYLFTRWVDLARIDLPPAVIGGAVTSGYILIAFFGALAFSWSTMENGQVTEISVPLVDALLIAGIIYPLVFGSLGGYLSAA